VISIDFARDAAQRLQAAGLHVDLYEHHGGHHLDPRILPLMTDWVSARRAAFAT